MEQYLHGNLRLINMNTKNIRLNIYQLIQFLGMQEVSLKLQHYFVEFFFFLLLRSYSLQINQQRKKKLILLQDKQNKRILMKTMLKVKNIKNIRMHLYRRNNLEEIDVGFIQLNFFLLHVKVGICKKYQNNMKLKKKEFQV